MVLKSCDVNELYNGKKCVCKPGFKTDKQKCIKIPVPKKCSDNKTFKKDKCVCRGDLVEQHGKCVAPLTQKRCPRGSLKNKSGNCICIGQGFVMNNNKCTRKRKTNMNSFQKKAIRNSHHVSNTFGDGLTTIKALAKENAFNANIFEKIIDQKNESPDSMNHSHNENNTILRECPDSTQCLLLNHKLRPNIKKLFDNFKTFKSLTKVEDLLTEHGKNASILLLTYAKNNYKTNAIMKLQNSSNSDSLVYEYLMGLEINGYRSRFPNFIETYGLYERDQKFKLYNNVEKFKNKFVYNAAREPELIRQFVEERTKNALLVESVNKSVTLDKKLTDENFIKNELIYVLFQIYYTLYKLRSEFAHYDLHPGNVLLYEPYKLTQFVYHIDNKEYAFCSKYVVKMIDYGRCYTKKSPEMLRVEEKQTSLFNLRDATKASYKTINHSQDLLLLSKINTKTLTVLNTIRESEISLFLDSVMNITEGVIPYKKSSGNTINNIDDAYHKLLKIIKQIIKHSDSCDASADIHIYDDGPYKLICPSQYTNQNSPRNSNQNSPRNSNQNLNNFIKMHKNDSDESVSDMTNESSNSYNSDESLSEMTNESSNSYNSDESLSEMTNESSNSYNSKRFE